MHHHHHHEMPLKNIGDIIMAFLQDIESDLNELFATSTAPSQADILQIVKDNTADIRTAETADASAIALLQSNIADIQTALDAAVAAHTASDTAATATALQTASDATATAAQAAAVVPTTDTVNATDTTGGGNANANADTNGGGVETIVPNSDSLNANGQPTGSTDAPASSGAAGLDSGIHQGDSGDGVSVGGGTSQSLNSPAGGSSNS